MDKLTAGSKRLMYVGGPMRARSKEEFDANVHAAKVVAADGWRSGYVVICPHLNGGPMVDMDVNEDILMAGHLELARMCGTFKLLPGWEDSDGTRDELNVAHAAGATVVPSYSDATWVPRETPPSVQWRMPWEEPPLDKWYIVAINHYIRDGEKRMYCGMTCHNFFIEARGPDAEAIFKSLKHQAKQVAEFVLPDDSK